MMSRWCKRGVWGLALMVGGLVAEPARAGDNIVSRMIKGGEKEPVAPVAKATSKWTEPIATVNGGHITLEQLAEELIATYGKKHLELMVNRKIVELACQERNIEITRAEVENEVNQTCKKLNLSRKEFISHVLSRRDLTYQQYVRDTVWPALALKRLVADKVKVGDEDLKKAFVANYGEKVDCRMLVVRELRKSQELWERINKEQEPDKRLKLFEDLAKTHSIDEATRPFGGQCQPINRHTAFSEVENAAFGLQPGELSKIIQAPEGNLMLLCVQRIPAQANVSLDTVLNDETKETVRDLLTKDLHEKMTRAEVGKFFTEIHEKAKKNMQNYLTQDFDADIQRTSLSVEGSQRK